MAGSCIAQVDIAGFDHVVMQTMDEYTPDIPEQPVQPVADPRASPRLRLPMRLPVPPFAFEAWDTKAEGEQA